MTDTIQHLLEKYIHDTENPEINFQLALAYDDIGQTAAAVSFYLRSAERTDATLLAYECLLKCSNCFAKQGSRPNTTKGLLQHALCVRPDRPEGYFLLSRLHERTQQWQEAYMMACIGLSVADKGAKALRTDVEYPGWYGLIFEKAVAAWWVGLCDESRKLLRELDAGWDMDEVHRIAVKNNLNQVGYPAEPTKYDRTKATELRRKFRGIDKVDTNYAQSFQDLFVLMATNGKVGGTYLEIGSSFPFHNNNTALLETKFGWKGISVDFDSSTVKAFLEKRKNTVLCADATTLDYDALLTMIPLGSTIDYLQVDVEPAETTLAALKRIPFDKYKFATITFEHDAYRSDSSVREEQREFLRSHGYVLVVRDVSFGEDNTPFEDWWVHPDLVEPEILEQLMHEYEGNSIFVCDYIYSKDK